MIYYLSSLLFPTSVLFQIHFQFIPFHPFQFPLFRLRIRYPFQDLR